MKKLLTLVLITFAPWSIASATKTPEVKRPPPKTKEVPKKSNPHNFRCDGRQYCGQMRSRAEAEFFLKNCPNTKMDGDNDGIPCENDTRF